jgi:tRNA-(ms[2]io[6]A)-hydroxylase
MSFVAKYPDRIAILPELIETGIEELEHFQQVFQLMQRFGIALKKEIPKDHYVLDLLKHCKSDVEGRFFDRLLLSSIIECRGAERFRLVYENHDDPEIKKFYHELWASEAKHGHIFVKFALEYFDEKKVYKRLQELNEIEYTVLKELPIRAALH